MPSTRPDTVDHLEIRIRTARDSLHRSRHELLRCLARYDLFGHWATTGASSCANWAADELRVSRGTAREWLRIGHSLLLLPAVETAFADGTLSYTSVRLLTRVAVDHPDRADELVAVAASVGPRDLPRALAAWTHRHEDPSASEERRRRNTHLSFRLEPDGMGVLTLRLPALDMGALHAAVDARVMQGVPAHDGPSPRRSLGHQRAVALVDLLLGEGRAVVTTELLVHLRSDGLTLHDGTPVSDHALARLLDTATLRALVHDARGRPVNASGRQRHPTVRQRRVVDERHPRCVDCGGTELLEYDPDPPFALTRRTVVEELARRCWRCHVRRHAGGSVGQPPHPGDREGDT